MEAEVANLACALSFALGAQPSALGQQERLPGADGHKALAFLLRARAALSFWALNPKKALLVPQEKCVGLHWGFCAKARAPALGIMAATIDICFKLLLILASSALFLLLLLHSLLLLSAFLF